jgi:addiction module HigA family antidote
MSHHSSIQRYDYHNWANNRFFDHLDTLPDKVYNNEIQSVFSSISEVIAHIYQVDALWLSVMAGDSFEETMTKINQINEQSDDKDLNQMQLLYADLAEEYTAFLRDRENLDEIIRGKRGVSSNTAWLLSGAFNTSPEFWLNLQSMHDLSSDRPSKHITPIKAVQA